MLGVDDDKSFKSAKGAGGEEGRGREKWVGGGGGGDI